MRILKHRALAGSAALLTALAAVAGSATGAAADGPGGPAPVTAQVWMTTANGADELTDLGSVAFSTAAAGVPTVVVDPTLTYQTMQGFGGAITDSSASVLYTLPPRQRAQVMASLFSPHGGDGLDYLRQPIGASDMVAGTTDYTYDDRPAGQTDYSMADFSIAHDQAEILPLLREAEALNPHLRVIATPWSPPAWMKTNDSLIGGQLIDSPQIYQRLRALSAQVHRGLPRQRGRRRRDHRAERAAEPHPRHVSGHGHALLAGGGGDRGPRPDAQGGTPAHRDLHLRPQLVRAPERHREHPAGRDRRHQRLPRAGHGLAGRAVDLRRLVPLLLRRSRAP